VEAEVAAEVVAAAARDAEAEAEAEEVMERDEVDTAANRAVVD
jgi:hypothetical protein